MSGSGSIGAERHHLARQVQAFKLQAKKLKKIFKDTVTVLSDLQDFDEALSIDQILRVDAHKCISNVVSGRTALVVFGDTRLRVSIVNEILGKVPRNCDLAVHCDSVHSSQDECVHFSI